MALQRMMRRITICLSLAAPLAVPATASALDVGVEIEPGLALPLTAPQSSRFTLGGELTLKGYVGLGRWFDLQAGVAFLSLAAAKSTVPATMGTAWSDSLGLRLHRPHDADLERGGFYAGAPWIDADADYVRTGPLDRFGVTVGAGVSFPLSQSRVAWLGPFVRYMQIVEPKRVGFDSGEGRFLFVGLNFELGTSPIPPSPAVLAPPPAVECPVCAPPPPPLSDRDHDGTPDSYDNCPDVAGPRENQGCPLYKKVIVKADKLELSEKIFFAFDRSDIEPVSYPLLDEVVQALKDNKGFRVAIEGHTDSVGPAEHNQTLSEGRASAVQKYLLDHGIPQARLSYEGFGSKVPTDTNKTAAGRENNRRVEFVVHFRILDRSAQ